MLKEEKVYVRKDKALRVEIIRLHHDIPVGEHGGQWKMTELVTRNSLSKVGLLIQVQTLYEYLVACNLTGTLSSSLSNPERNLL